MKDGNTTISAETLRDVEHKQKFIKSMSRKMILETKIQKLSKSIFYLVLAATIVYCVHHYLMYDHIFHFHENMKH